MKEQTVPAQKTPRVTPLYLPEIYAVLIRNTAVFPQEIDASLREGWEKSFLTCVKVLGLGDDQMLAPFWTDSSTKSVLKNTPNDKFQEAIRESSSLLNLYKTEKTARIDQTYSPACEAVGLVAYRGKVKNVQMSNPTNFFSDLIKSNGAVAAIKMLCRFLTIPYSSVEGVVFRPRDLIIRSLKGDFNRKNYYEKDLKGYENSSIDAYAVGIYSRGIYPWIADSFPSKDDRPIDEIHSLLTLTEPYILTEENWRDVIPNNELLKSVSSLILARAQKMNSDQADLDQLKKDLEFLATHTVTDRGSPVSQNSFNLIFVGPPGTGKSRIVNLLAAKLVSGIMPNLAKIRDYSRDAYSTISTENIFRVQFHPSYNYEDFIEGIRPLQHPLSPISVRYSVTQGPFKVMCQLARAYHELLKYGEDSIVRYSIPIIGFAKTHILDGKSISSLIIPEEYSSYSLDRRDGILSLNESSEKEIFKGPIPRQIELPVGTPEGIYQLNWRPIHNLESEVNFVLIIDELNRGNPSKIFGEVLSLIESSKRLGKSEEIQLSLPYSKQKFCIPPNIHLLCSMNLADRSLSTLDQAFKRRFKFIYLAPDWELILNKNLYAKVTGSVKFEEKAHKAIAAHLRSINAALGEMDVPEENYIGHSYGFQALDEYYSDAKRDLNSTITNLWRNEIHPLLKDIIGARVEEFIQKYDKLKDDSVISSEIVRKALKEPYMPEDLILKVA